MSGITQAACGLVGRVARVLGDVGVGRAAVWILGLMVLILASVFPATARAQTIPAQAYYTVESPDSGSTWYSGGSGYAYVHSDGPTKNVSIVEFTIPAGETYSAVNLSTQFINYYGFPAALTIKDAAGVGFGDSNSGSAIRGAATFGSATIPGNGSGQTIPLNAGAVQRMNDISGAGGGVFAIGLTGPANGTYFVEFTSMSLEPDSAPTVTSLSPSFGGANGGAVVTLTGTNFIGATAVYFGSTPATFSVGSASQITADAPAGSGTVNVRVEAGGQLSPIAAGNQYTYHAPIIAPVTVTGGTASVSGTFTPGQSPRINLYATADASTVLAFRNPTADGSGAWSTSFDMSALASASYFVGLYDDDAGAEVTYRSFTYTSPTPVPTVTSLGPNSGATTGGTPVTVMGSGFTGATAVNFGGVPATNFSIQSDTAIIATSPAGTAGPVDVTVTSLGGASATGAGAVYTYVEAPTIGSVSPAEGIAHATDRPANVTIAGSNFSASGNSVNFGGVPGTIVSESTTSIVVTPPANATGGLVNIDVFNAAFQSGSAVNAYRYILPPTVTVTFSPDTITGFESTRFTVTLTNPNPVALQGVRVASSGAATPFALTSFVNSCSTGNHNATAGYHLNGFTLAAGASCSDISDQASSAGGVYQFVTNAPTSTGTATTAMTLTGVPATSNAVTAYRTASITSVSPNSGPQAGGTAITITGTNFTGATGVTVDGVAATNVIVASNTSITATTPASASAGARTVAVTNPAGTGTRTNAFTYNALPDAPTITAPANNATTALRPTYAGSAPSGSTVTVYVDGASIGTTLAGGGAWTLQNPTTFGEGETHTVYATAATVSQGTSPSSSTITFTTDGAAPAAPTVTAPTDGSRLNTLMPTLSGTVEAGASVEVYVDGALVATRPGSTTGGGTWSFTTSTLTQGSHAVWAIAQDGAGNRSPQGATITFVVDTDAPAVPILLSPSTADVIYGDTAVLSGSAEALAEVLVHVDGALVGTATADAGGGWSFQVSGSGEIRVNLAARDQAGNESGQSSPYAFTFDATPLTAPVVTTPAAGSHTRDTTPTFKGTTAAGATITIRSAGMVQATTTADGSGAWTVDLPTQADAQYVYAVTASRGAVVSPNRNVSLRIDTAAPAAPTLTAPADDEAATAVTPTFAGTGEPFTGINLLLDGNVYASGIAVDGSGAWTFTFPGNGVGSGVYVATVTNEDLAGNVSPVSNSRTFTVDRTAPPVPQIQSPSEGQSVTGQPTIQGMAENNSQVTVAIDGVDYMTVQAGGSGRWNVEVSDTPLSEGPHTVAARAADALGNSSALSAVINFVVDDTPPAAPVVVSPAAGQALTGVRPTFTGTAEPDSTVVLYVDGGSLERVSANGSGAWSYTHGQDLAEGAHFVEVEAHDGAGNRSPRIDVAFRIDTSAPASPLVSTPAEGFLSNARSVVLSGTAEADAEVLITLDGAVQTVPADGTGQWSYNATALADGAHAFTVQARDAAGFTSSPTAPRSFSVDATAPATPTISAPVDGSILADSTPTITGSAEAGSTVVVTLDGAALAPIMVDGSGLWSLTSGVLADGPHAFTVIATDTVGHVSPVSAASFIIDSAAPATPVITAPANGSVTDDGTPTISGTAEAGVTVNLSIDGAAAVTAVASGGVWSYTPSATLSAGGHTLSATATDGVGNVSPASAAVSFTYSPMAITTASLPSGQVGVAYAATIAVAGGTAPYSFATTAGALPPGVTLAADGALSGAATTSGAFTFTTTATDANGLSTSAAFSVTIAPPADPVVTDVENVDVTANADGSGEPTVIDLSTAVTNAARIEIVTPPAQGTATVNGFRVLYLPEVGYFGTDSFTYRAIGFTDGGNSSRGLRTSAAAQGTTAEATVTVRIAAPTLILAGGALPVGQIGVTYAQTLTASGGTAPYTYAVTAGALPAGISLASNGTLTGSPSSGGAFSFTVTATDSSTGTGPFSIAAAYTVTIDAPALAVTPSALPNATVAQAYNQALSTTGGVAPYTYVVTGGALPTGLTLSNDGVLSGSPTQGGAFTFTVSATDASTGAGPYTASQMVTLTVSGSTIAVAPASLPAATRGTAYSQSVTASGGVAPYTYAIASGALPAGLTLSSTGQISGTPTVTGSFTFAVRATDSATGAGPYFGGTNLTLTVGAASLTVTPTTLPDVLAGTTFSQQMQATGGQGGYTFAVTSGALPAGVALSSAGVLAGRPTAAGTFGFTVMATDGFGNTGAVGLSLTVTGRPDPSADPDVRGLNTAQAEAARRMAGTQISNFGRRLESLHSGQGGQSSVALNLSLDAHAFTPLDEGQRTMGELGQVLGQGMGGARDLSGREELARMMAAGSPEGGDPGTGRVDGQLATGQGAAPADPPDGPRIWAGGAISLGERDATTQAAEMSITTSGISAGVDISVADTLDVGVGVGFGQERTDVGAEVSRMEAESWVGVAYASWRPAGSVFVDGMFGYGELAFDMRRKTPVNGDVVLGERDGSVWFSSLSTGLDRTVGSTRWIGYGRLEMLSADLDAFTETGSALWALSYDARTVQSVQGVLGLRYERDIQNGHDRWTPGFRLEWGREFADAGRQGMRYADWLDGPGYLIGHEGWERSQFNLGLSLGFQAESGWSWSGEYEGGFSEDESLNSLRIRLAKPF